MLQVQTTSSTGATILAGLLDQIAREYAMLTGRGGMQGLLLVDQDAKVLAKNSLFCLKRPWDMGAIGSALFGIAMQASGYMGAANLERVSIVFGDKKLFVRSLGKIDVGDGREPRTILLVIIAIKEVKEGLVIIQMKKHAGRILETIQECNRSTSILRLNERDVKEYLLELGGNV